MPDLAAGPGDRLACVRRLESGTGPRGSPRRGSRAGGAVGHDRRARRRASRGTRSWRGRRRHRSPSRSGPLELRDRLLGCWVENGERHGRDSTRSQARSPTRATTSSPPAARRHRLASLRDWSAMRVVIADDHRLMLDGIRRAHEESARARSRPGRIVGWFGRRRRRGHRAHRARARRPAARCASPRRSAASSASSRRTAA